jgi:hypothetical protein
VWVATWVAGAGIPEAGSHRAQPQRRRRTSWPVFGVPAENVPGSDEITGDLVTVIQRGPLCGAVRRGVARTPTKGHLADLHPKQGLGSPYVTSIGKMLCIVGGAKGVGQPHRDGG